MKRMVPSLLALVAAAFLAFHVGDDLGRWAMRLGPPPGEVTWLGLEFGAGSEQLERLAMMQLSYRGRSAAQVAQVEEASRRVASGLDRSGALTPALREDLATLEAARAKAHELALEHCMDVARVLGPVHGPRYLHEMERVLLGLAPRHHSVGTHASRAFQPTSPAHR